MGRIYDLIDDRLAAWITAQPVFFVATAPLAADGHVNCSPKGNRGELKVLGPRRIAYLDQTGSGAETIAHLKENGRIVLMMCAFEGPPRIVRLHGRGEAVLVDDPRFGGLTRCFDGTVGPGARSVIAVNVDRIADSCGYGVPLMPFSEHRTTMDEWAERKGDEGIRRYWADTNAHSLDGLPSVPRGGPR